MTDFGDQEWNEFISLIDEAKEFLLLAEQGEMCLDQLKSLSDRGMQIMKQADQRQDKNLKIVMLDINMMEILLKIFKLNVRTLSPDRFVFDPVIHAHKILNVVGLRKESAMFGQTMINILAPVASQVFSHRAAGLNVLTGLELADPIKTAKAPKVPKARLPKDKIEPVKAPETVSEVTGRTVEATIKVIEKQLEDAYKANKEAPLCYVKFAFHPTSFSKTVENIFHISFLVNHSIASIFLDANGNPCIKPLPKNLRDKTRDNNSALVMSINQNEWKEGIRLFGVTEPMIRLTEVDIPGNTSIPTNQKRKRRTQQQQDS